MLNRISAAVIGCALLSGCVTTSSSTAVINTISLPTAIQTQTAAICGYVPTASTLAQLIATYTGSNAIAGYAELAATVAHDICAAVAPTRSAHLMGMHRGTVLGVVNGVLIRGRFVR